MALLPTIQRVLEVPELLDTIFRFLDNSCNASNARVCKKWSDIALDILWRNVDDLYRLFSILAPLRVMENEFEFDRLPDPSDWSRFERYRRRVRRLTYHAFDPFRILHHSVFDDIARTRTNLDILPSMHTFEWHAPLPLCSMFMHTTIKQFHIHLPDILADISPRPFFLDISTRMPHLTHLDIRTRVPMRCIEDETVTLLTSLQRLRKLVLPRYTLTGRLVEALSRLDRLEVVEFQYHSYQGCGDPEDLAGFSPILAEGAFPALWDFSTTLSCAAAAHFFDLPFAPATLTTLYLDSRLIETPADVHRLLAVLADTCQLLQTLGLTTHVDASASPPAAPPDKDRCISLETLDPLFRCARLVSLEVSHHCPLSLRQDDVEKLAGRWPALETLLLNSEPAYIDHPGLTLEALVPFATHCPALRHLGLFLDASVPAPPVVPERYPVFGSLKRLSVGVSVIKSQEEGAVALFLSQVCPLQCQLESGVTWDEAADVARAMAASVLARCERWDKVAELLPLLIKLRVEERERTRALNEEVEDLRVRTGVLRDRAGVGRVEDSCITS